MLNKIENALLKKGYGQVSNIKRIVFYRKYENVMCYIEIKNEENFYFIITNLEENKRLFVSNIFKITKNLEDVTKTVDDFCYKFSFLINKKELI